MASNGVTLVAVRAALTDASTVIATPKSTGNAMTCQLIFSVSRMPPRDWSRVAMEANAMRPVPTPTPSIEDTSPSIPASSSTDT